MEQNVDNIIELTRAVENLAGAMENVSSAERIDIEDTMTKILALIDAITEKELEELENTAEDATSID